MLTPSFKITQNEDTLTISISVPYVKISDAEVYFEGNCFKFYCKPYFLHLQLPGKLAEDGRGKSSYDVESGTVVVQVGKLNRGEEFPNLDMLTTLLPCRQRKDLRRLGEKPRIEELESGVGVGRGAEGEEGEATEEDTEEDLDWGVDQNFSSEAEGCSSVESVDLLSGLVPYGFALQNQGVFLKLQEEIPSIVECPDPDHMTPHERRIGRIASEEAAFNEDHYLADLMDNDYISELLAFRPPWTSELEKWRARLKSSTSDGGGEVKEEPGPDIVQFTAAEREKLKNFPNRVYLLDKATRRSLYLGLVDIIFAYAYNLRSTEGEGNVESAWTICKLSSTLSWLEVYRGGVHEVVYCSLRRSLCYPLYRHWEFSLAVLQDLRDLFRLGRRKLLQCVLDIRDILNSSEPYYILNNLYITDYAIWLQSASVRQILRLAEELDEVKVGIGSLGWGLVELGEAAVITAQEEALRTSGAQDGTKVETRRAQDGTKVETRRAQDGTEVETRRAQDGTEVETRRAQDGTEVESRTLGLENRGAEQAGNGTETSELKTVEIRDEIRTPELGVTRTEGNSIQEITEKLQVTGLGASNAPLIEELGSEVSSEGSCSSSCSSGSESTSESECIATRLGHLAIKTRRGSGHSSTGSGHTSIAPGHTSTGSGHSSTESVVSSGST